MDNVALNIPMLEQQPVSVTRQMASALPQLKKIAESKGLKLHHLGAGYPHPEVSDPTNYIKHKNAYFEHLSNAYENTEQALKKLLIESYSYTDTLGPKQARDAFAKVYGNDFGFTIQSDYLIPTMGATGGIATMCSLFERSAKNIAYIVDAPTYAGFLSRASLYQKASFYSVEIDEEGPLLDQFRSQIKQAREDGNFVAFYYTVPDGHNPGGISFSQKRREKIIEIVKEEGIFIVEDAPYTYISFESAENRQKPFIALDPKCTVHLFTASKIGLPGPRVGLLYSEVELFIKENKKAFLKDLVLTESSGNLLLHNPESLRAFEAYLTDENFEIRESLWPVAASKNAVYGENREILLSGMEKYLGEFPEYFSWTKPGAGFFTVFTFKKGDIKTNQEFVQKLVATYGVITIPMFGFYPKDAKKRNPEIGLNQLRLSFSFNESLGEERRKDMEEAAKAFCNAVRIESGLPAIS